MEARRDMMNAICREIALRSRYINGKVQTIYFGGGTPSLASKEELQSILETLHTHFPVAADCEVTLEANPDDLTSEKLKELRELGINRLSIGIQSFQEEILRFLNRAHDAKAALNCIPMARTAGFDNISIDLIYAIPSQSLEAWRENVVRAIALQPEHISAYSLTIEEKTVFGNWTSKGKLQPVSEENAAGNLELLLQLMESGGYEHYEISNFALPGRYSRHNSSYWMQEMYLGIGPSAHSYNGTTRQYNVSNNHQYIRAISSGQVPATVENLSPHDIINDYLLTTLRTSWGCDLLKLRTEMHYDLQTDKADYLASLVKNDFASISDHRLVLTKRGKFLADKISADLFVSS